MNESIDDLGVPEETAEDVRGGRKDGTVTLLDYGSPPISGGS